MCDFFFKDRAATEMYTLSLHDALPILLIDERGQCWDLPSFLRAQKGEEVDVQVCLGKDRKSTRLNSSHSQISYAVFCLKKKNRIISSSRCRTMSCASSPNIPAPACTSS